jgi:hypothetical protein
VSGSPSFPDGPEGSNPFTLEDFKTLITAVEMLYSVGLRLSDSIRDQQCTFLVQEATMAFVKTMMSLLGFLRFIPPSRFFAREVETLTDLSSASVMGRQVIEDMLAFLYLSEPNLSPEQEKFRERVWRFHGAKEALDLAKFAGITGTIVSQSKAVLDEAEKALDDDPLLRSIENERRGRIRKGQLSRVAYDNEILSVRGILLDKYNLARKYLSNFAHFSMLSHRLIMQTNSDWETSWNNFLHPALYVANFTSEAIEVFLETFPQARQLLTDVEQKVVAKYRTWLRDAS